MRVAVLGLGSIGARHARNLLELGHDVVGFDPGQPTDGRWASATTADEAISGVDAVVVASPSSMHADHASSALQAGLPVLVEKPLATNSRAAERLAALARERRVTCGVAMNLRFHPAVLELRRLVAGNRLGSIRYAHVSCGSDLRRWRPGVDYRNSYSARAELGGGVVRDCIHELDYLTWLLGPTASITAETANVSDLEIDVEDLGLALLRLSSGALASVDLTYFDPAYRRGCLLVGALATARWDWKRGTIELAHADGNAETLDVAADVSSTYVAELRDFLQAIETGRPPSTTAEEGAAVLRLVDALFQSARGGRRITL
jgi:predicted dehydrogenase